MSTSDIQRQLALLRQYNKALESENQSRNQQRIFLENQLDRLSEYVRELQSKNSLNKDCQNCEKLRMELVQMEAKCSKLERQKNNFESNYQILSKQISSRTTVTSTAITTNFSQLTQIKYDFENLKKKNESLQNSVIEYKRIAEDKQNTIRSLQGQLSKINSKLYSFETSIQRYQLEISQLKRRPEPKVVVSTPIPTSQIQTYKLQISNWKYKYQQFQHKYTTVYQSFQHYKRQVENKQQTISNLLSQVSQLNTKLYSLEGSVNKYELEIKELKNKPQPKIVVSTPIKNMEIESYKTQINSWRASYEEYQKKYQETNRKFEEANKKADEFYHKFNDLNSNYQSLVKQERKLYDEKITIQNKVNELQRQKMIIKNQINMLKTDVEYKNGQISRLKSLSSTPTYSQQLEQLKNQKYDLTSKVDRLTFELNEIKRRQTNLNSQLSTAIRQKEQKQSEIRLMSNYQSEIRMLREQIKTKQTQIFELRERRNNEFQQIISDKEDQIDKLKITIAQLRTEIQFLQKRASQNLHIKCQSPSRIQEQTLKMETTRLNSIIISIRNQNNIYIQRNKDLQRRISILQETNNNLQNQLRIMIEEKSKIYTQRKDITELNEHIRKLRSDLMRSKDQNDLLKKENELILEKLDHLQKLQTNVMTRERQKLVPVPGEENRQSFQHGHHHHHHYEGNQYLAKNRKKYHHEITKASSTLNEKKWKSLQEKIAHLKNENQGLKRTLNDMSQY